MSVIEFQVSTAAFLAAQLNNLQTQQICSPAPVTVGSYQIVLDHVEFGGNSVRHNVPTTEVVFFEQALFGRESQEVNAFKSQFAQSLTIFLTDLNNVLAHPNQPPSLIVPVPATMVVTMRYYQTFDDCFLAFSFDQLELGALPPLPPGIDANFVTQQLQQLAQTLISGKAKPFNLAEAILGSSVQIENAGMSIDAGLSRIAFRAELGDGTEYSPIHWQDFYKGDVPDRLQGRDWAFFIDGPLFGSIVAAPVYDKLHASSKFHLVSGVAGYYSSAAPDRAHVQIPFGGNVDTPICTAFVDVTLDADITVDKLNPNTLAVDMHMSRNVHGSACTIAAGALGALVGGVVDLVMPFAVGIINPVSGFLAGVCAALYVENSYAPSVPLQHCTQLSDTHYSCTKTFAVKDVSQFGSLAFNGLSALGDGVSLLGDLRPKVLASAAAVTVSFRPFAWRPPGVSCGSAGPEAIAFFAGDPQHSAFLFATIALDNTGEAPLSLCRFAVQNDPLNVFQNAQIQVTNPTAPITLTVAVGFPGDQYYTNPYPFELLVFTNGGVRLISLPPLPVLTQQDIDKLEALMVVEVANCEQLVDPWFQRFHGYNPKWSVDPPVDASVEHIWEVTVIGLNAGETASLVDETGRTLATANAVGGMTTQLSALAAPSAQIGIVRGGAAGPALAESSVSTAALVAQHGHGHRGIAVRQELLIERSVIALSDACERIGTAYIGAAPVVFAISRDRLAAFDLTLPGRPAPLGSWSIAGLRGALPWRRGLLAFGADGFATIGPDGRLRAADRCCRERAVLDAVTGIGTVIAAGRESLDIYSPNLALAASVPARATRLARLGTVLAAAGQGGLRFFDIADPLSPVSLHERLAIEAVDLAVPPDSPGHMLVAVAQAAASLIWLPPRGAPEIVGSFARPPWFVHSARLPGLLARLTEERSAIRIGTFGAAATI